jgi:hypothetical protein
MPFPLIFAAVALAASAYSASSSAKTGAATNKNANSWNKYNAEVQYRVDSSNIEAQKMITSLNQSVIKSTSVLTNRTNDAIDQANISLISATNSLNDILYEEDIVKVWDEANLNTSLIGMERARERGTLIANQSASGTTLGVGSNADAVIDQMTQEALDKFIIKYGADKKAGDILNAKAISNFQADQEIKKITYEGRIRNATNTLSTDIQIGAMQVESDITSIADLLSADLRRNSTIGGGNASTARNQAVIDSNFKAGLVNAAASGASTYAATK